ncbi:hypothetical protein T492DRAFT_420394 [Pavlovales sp. CCMP2436]|nr:hypothetical protein T492DRAFT_420394 [Pavlovales sp. CCMP2436]
MDPSAPRNNSMPAERQSRIALAPPAKPASRNGGEPGEPGNLSSLALAPSAKTATRESAFDYSNLARERRATAAAKGRDAPAGFAKDDEPFLTPTLQLGIKKAPPPGVPRRVYYASISHLHLDAQRITDLPGVSALPALSVVYIRENLLSSLAGFNSLPQLTELHADDNLIASLADGFEAPPMLKVLSVQHNAIGEVAGLRTCPSLASLHLSFQHLPEYARDSLDLPRSAGGGEGESGDEGGGGGAAPGGVLFAESSMAAVSAALRSVRAAGCGLDSLVHFD